MDETLPPEPRDPRGRLLLAAIAALLVAVGIVSVGRDGHRLPAAGSDAPTVEIPLLDGGTLDLAALRGKVVVLDFWATWCAPCVESMPVVRKVGEELAGKGVVTVAVNGDDGDRREELVRHFLRRQKLEGLTVALDDGSAARAFEVTALPTLVVIGRDGKVATAHLGAVDEPLLRSLVTATLGD